MNMLCPQVPSWQHDRRGHWLNKEFLNLVLQVTLSLENPSFTTEELDSHCSGSTSKAADGPRNSFVVGGPSQTRRRKFESDFETRDFEDHHHAQ